MDQQARHLVGSVLRVNTCGQERKKVGLSRGAVEL